MIIAIDPGKHECGLAAVHAGALLWAGLARRGAGEDMAQVAVDMLFEALRIPDGFELVMEKPQIYTDQHRKGSQEPLIDLAIILGRITGLLTHSWDFVQAFYEPGQWKGQVPKPIHHARLKARLTVIQPKWTEHVAWPIKTLQHNVLDAIGLAFHHDKVLTSRAAAR